MSQLLKAIQLTADMIERRDFLRRLFGQKYVARTKPAKDLLLMLHERTGRPFIQVGLDLCNKVNADGRGETVSVIIAAMVDLIETPNA